MVTNDSFFCSFVTSLITDRLLHWNSEMISTISEYYLRFNESNNTNSIVLIVMKPIAHFGTIFAEILQIDFFNGISVCRIEKSDYDVS